MARRWTSKSQDRKVYPKIEGSTPSGVIISYVFDWGFFSYLPSWFILLIVDFLHIFWWRSDDLEARREQPPFSRTRHQGIFVPSSQPESSFVCFTTSSLQPQRSTRGDGWREVVSSHFYELQWSKRARKRSRYVLEELETASTHHLTKMQERTIRPKDGAGRIPLWEMWGRNYARQLERLWGASCAIANIASDCCYMYS